MDTLGKRFRINFLVYAYWFMSISISQLKDYSISVYQSSYATAVVPDYPDTVTVKENPEFHKTTFPHDMILTK